MKFPPRATRRGSSLGRSPSPGRGATLKYVNASRAHSDTFPATFRSPNGFARNRSTDPWAVNPSSKSGVGRPAIHGAFTLAAAMSATFAAPSSEFASVAVHEPQ